MEESERQRIIEERKQWYSQTFVLFEIVKGLKHRELCFLTPKFEEKKKAVRYLLALNVDYLRKHFQAFAFEKSLMNMYHSVAVLRDVPVFSYNLMARKHEDIYQEFNKNYEKYAVGYNFFFDVDGKENPALAFEEAKQIKNILEEFKVPYYLLNSSKTGFHFVVPSWFLSFESIDKTLEVLNNVLYNIIGIYDFKCLDPSIIDMKRVQKVPYSYECSGCICLPLDDEQFQNFSPKIVEAQSVMANNRIKNRGLLIREYGLNEEQLKENVKKFLGEFQ